MHFLKFITVSVVSVSFWSAHATAGNERGGGTSPPPVFMPEAAVYTCEIALTQLGAAIDVPGALVSRATATLSWNKGDYAGSRGIDLKDISQWSHAYLVSSGPSGRRSEVVTPSAPDGAIFSGAVSIRGSSGDRSSTDVKMELSVHVASNVIDKTIDTRSAGSSSGSLELREKLEATASLDTVSASGEYLDDRNLNVTCERVR